MLFLPLVNIQSVLTSFYFPASTTTPHSVIPLQRLAKLIPRDLLPLNLLPSDRQLSPESLEGTFSHANERPVQFLLVVALGRSDA